MISGEPIPVDKVEGDKVTAGSINGNQSFVMRAQKVGAETLLSQIIEMADIEIIKTGKANKTDIFIFLSKF
jgi:Cu2+-exporting ATPase